MHNIDLTCVHHLSGPIAVKDKEGKLASPGDLLVVEILNLGALPGDEWGLLFPMPSFNQSNAFCCFVDVIYAVGGSLQTAEGSSESSLE